MPAEVLAVAAQDLGWGRSDITPGAQAPSCRTRQEDRPLPSVPPHEATTGLEPTVANVTWWDRGEGRAGGEQPSG